MSKNRNQTLVKNKDTRNLNNIGARIRWCRRMLDFTMQKVSDDIGVSTSVYSIREYGVRPQLIEEYLVLAEYFEREFKTKFRNDYPKYEGQYMSKICPLWLMFGIIK